MSKSEVKLFLGTFTSAFLFLFGAGTLLLMFAPAAAQIVTTEFNAEYAPQLPLSSAKGEAAPEEAPARQPYPALTELNEPHTGDAIIIPAIDVNVPMVLSPSMQDNSILQTLADGAALYPNGISPGQPGNVFIAAHSTGEPWKGKYRFAFLRINELETGNLIHLDHKGARYTYRITAKDIIKPDPNFKIESDRPVPTVTLMACWPLWSTSQRMLIKGELTNITQLTPRPI